MTSTPPYLDRAALISDRVEDLLGRMTLPEKVGQMLQLDARDDLEDIVLTRLAGFDPARVARAAGAGDGPGCHHPSCDSAPDR